MIAYFYTTIGWIFNYKEYVRKTTINSRSRYPVNGYFCCTCCGKNIDDE